MPRDRRHRSSGCSSMRIRRADMLIVDVDWVPESQQRRVSGAGPGADVARPESRRRGVGPHQPRAARNHARLGERQRQRDLAEGRIVPVAQRTSRLQAPVPLSPRRHPRRSGDRRTLGSSHVLWRGRRTWRRVLRRRRAPAHRHRHLPHRPRRAGPDAAVADRRHASRHLQSVVHAVRRRVERRRDAYTGPAASRRRRRGSRDRRERRSGARAVSVCRSRSSSKSGRATAS